MVSAATQKSMELEGNLSSFQLADVLKFLVMGRMTGALTLQSENRKIVLLVKEGTLTGSLSADYEQKLRQLLIHGKHVNPKQIEELLENRRVGRSLASLLIDKRLIEKDKLLKTVQLQVKEEVWEAFGWTTGSFKFEHGALPEHDEDLLSLAIEPLIEEGLERMEQWRGISKSLGELNEVYQVNHELSGLPAAPLMPNVWRVLSLINGRLNATALVELSGLGKFETLLALDKLVTMAMIEPAGKPERAMQSARPREAAAPRRDSAAAAAMPLEQEENPENGTGGGLRGLFGLKKKSQPGAAKSATVSSVVREPGDEPQAFKTGVGLACELLRRLAERIAADFGENASALLGEAWTAEMMRRPRADLVRFERGFLNSRRFDRYAELAVGAPKTMAATHDDTLAALRGVGRTLAACVRNHRGEEARRWMQDAIGGWLDHAEAGWPPEFSARTWASTWMND